MNSRQLEYFLAVAHELNFTKAAESMYVSQTAVTQQIKALDKEKSCSDSGGKSISAGGIFNTEPNRYGGGAYQGGIQRSDRITGDRIFRGHRQYGTGGKNSGV